MKQEAQGFSVPRQKDMGLDLGSRSRQTWPDSLHSSLPFLNNEEVSNLTGGHEDKMRLFTCNASKKIVASVVFSALEMKRAIGYFSAVFERD